MASTTTAGSDTADAGGPGPAAVVASARRAGRAAVPTRAAAAVRGDVLGPAGRRELRDRMRTRFTRNVATIAPLLTGAVAAGWMNRRATLDIGASVARDLGLAP